MLLQSELENAAAGQPHAFLFILGSAGTVTERIDLETLEGGFSNAFGVNNLGWVVGTSDGRAFLWDGGMIALDTLLPTGTGWELDAAWAINDDGDIVGMGRVNRFPRAFLMTMRLAGDADDDGDIDLFDFAAYVNCVRGPNAPTPTGCETFDFDGDQDVDMVDFSRFQVVFTGSA